MIDLDTEAAVQPKQFCAACWGGGKYLDPVRVAVVLEDEVETRMVTVTHLPVICDYCGGTGRV